MSIQDFRLGKRVTLTGTLHGATIMEGEPPDETLRLDGTGWLTVEVGPTDKPLTGDLFIVVSGGLVTNDPCIPVFDLDNLRDMSPHEVHEMLAGAIEAGATGEVATELRAELERCGYDTSSSASVQHFIDNGEYLLATEGASS